MVGWTCEATETGLPGSGPAESAVSVLEGKGQLSVQELVPSDAILVEGGGLLETVALAHGAAGGAGKALWIEDADGFAQLAPGVAR